MSADALHVRVRLQHPSLALDVDHRFPLDGVSAIFGPSGSGKSTLLRCIAGLDRPDQGQIQFGDACWFSDQGNVHVRSHLRPVGLMFQDARLFEHRSVAGNLDLAERFSPSRNNRTNATLNRDHVIEALDLAELLPRRPATLSGGEQRRVALARTLLARPALLLLDEPLTGLDADRKADILPYLERALREFALPALFVSHDIGEVAQLADTVLVLRQGQVQFSGPAAQVIESLDLDTITGRFEAGVLINGIVARHDQARYLTEVDLAGECLSMPIQSALPVGESIRLRIRARDVALATVRPEGLSIRNVLPGQLLQLTPEPEPGFVDALVQVADTRIRARLTQAAVEDLNLSAGSAVYVLIKSVSFEG